MHVPGTVVSALQAFTHEAHFIVMPILQMGKWSHCVQDTCPFHWREVRYFAQGNRAAKQWSGDVNPSTSWLHCISSLETRNEWMNA